MMIQMMHKIRCLVVPLLKNNKQIVVAFGFLALFVILPVVSCYAQEAFFGSYDHTAYLTYCNAEAFEAKYNGADQKCWSCDVVAILMDVMIDVVQNISSAALSLAQLILIYGSAVWLGVFFVKSLSSATAQDPNQILTSVFTFMFKVAFVYILVINYGFANLIDLIVNPLLSIGIDIGTEFSYWATGG